MQIAQGSNRENESTSIENDQADFSQFRQSMESLPDFKNNNVKLDDELITLLTHIANSAERIAYTLIMTDTHGYSGNPNNFGDNQLQLDVETEEIIMDELKKSKVCKSASSEETPVKVDCSESWDSSDSKNKF